MLHFLVVKGLKTNIFFLSLQKILKLEQQQKKLNQIHQQNQSTLNTMLRVPATSKPTHPANRKKSVNINNYNNTSTSRTTKNKSPPSAKSVTPAISPTNSNNNSQQSRNTTPLGPFNGPQTPFQNRTATTPNTPTTTQRRLLLSRLRLREHQEMVSTKEVELYQTFKENSFYTLHILERFRSKQISPAYRLPAMSRNSRRGGTVLLPPILSASHRKEKSGEITMTTVFTNNPIAKRFLEESIRRQSSHSVVNNSTGGIGVATTTTAKSKVKALLDVPLC